MKLPGLNQTRARRYAKRAQAAFLIVGAASLVVAIWGSRQGPSVVVEPLGQAALPQIASATTDQVPSLGIDVHGLADRLGRIANNPILLDKTGTEPPLSQDESLTGDDPVRFLGAVMEPTRRVALLKVGERQKLVGAGESFSSGAEQGGLVKVSEVGDDYVILEDGSGSRRIEKSTRQGPSVTYLSGAVPPSRGGPIPAVLGDQPSRLHAPGRPGAADMPVPLPPGSRAFPADRRPGSESSGERQ